MAAAHRFGAADMNVDGAGFLALLRRIERDAPHRPRIGRSERLADEIVEIGQDPQLGFAASDLSGIEEGPNGRVKLRAQFMGFFGPQGALPLNLTEEAVRWHAEGEEAFVRFTDILSSRFYQLFFRGWSDAHAISQHDRPAEDRFASYVLAIAGTGSASFLQHDDFPDIARLPLVSVFGGRVRSAVRLRQMLICYFDLPAEVEEHVPAWLEFESDELHGLGMGGALGNDVYLGSRLRSVSEKICIHLHIPDAESYREFLPGQPRYQRLANLVYWYLGRTYDVDLALTLPPDQIPPARIGDTVSLGWLAALAPTASDQDHIEVARFSLEHGH